MSPQPAKPRILIVDDNPANRLAFRTLLEPLYTVFVAAGGEEALELTLKHEFAVILLDVRMPVLSGFEVAEYLRRRERTAHTPIVFMSAYEKTDLHAKKGYVAGATDYLFSPVDEDLLKFKVATYVQIFLRNETLRLQIHGLQSAVRVLEREMQRRGPVEAELQERIRSLEEQVDKLERELGPMPI